MTDDSKGAAILAEAVGNMLELQSRHGMDQETMLIYMCSVNLTSILGLMGHHYPGSSNGYIQPPLIAPANVTAPGQSGSGGAGGSNSGGSASLNDLAGTLAGLLGNQGGSGGHGLNPAALMGLLSSLGGFQGQEQDGQSLNGAASAGRLNAPGKQNVDLNNLMSLFSSLMSVGAKNNPKPEPTQEKAYEPQTTVKTADAAKNDREKEKQQIVREVPKVMKWDNLDKRKRAQN